MRHDVALSEPEHHVELALASALAQGEPEALRIFERDLIPEITTALRRLRLSDAAVDEVAQALRVDLLVGPPPRIADYAGRGSLVGWLRVTATRRAFRMLRGTRHEDALDDMLLDQLPAAATDPAHAHLRARYTRELKRAVGEAFAGLELRQRNLLRQHILDQLGIDELAALYRVHRATCARWLADARGDLGRATRKQLGAALGLGMSELESLLRFLDSDIELSVSRLLGAA
ncbi:MAG: hypothetical protein SFX73_09200 [Kofleriaceae bacterium]|nr:hypothetical protein [Kofleriaceae bacterium]